MQELTLNEELMEAVASFDIEAVKSCLERGADPNYTRFRDEEEPNGYIQPTTPLRMVMFRISDSFLEDDDIKKFGEIAKILLKHGADPKPAMQIAECRYGKHDPNYNKNPFVEVWDIVANGK
jgi:hypothetical protein